MLDLCVFMVRGMGLEGWGLGGLGARVCYVIYAQPGKTGAETKTQKEQTYLGLLEPLQVGVDAERVAVGDGGEPPRVPGLACFGCLGVDVGAKGRGGPVRKDRRRRGQKLDLDIYVQKRIAYT